MHQFKALGFHQPRHDAEQGRVRPHLQPQLLLQSQLAFLLAFETAGREFGEQRFVFGRVVQFGVDPVDDADQSVAAPRQDAVEPFAPVAGLNLTGVTAADRTDEVGVLQAAFQKIHHAEKFQRRHRFGVMVQIEHVAKDAGREYPLILEVVDRAERFQRGAPGRLAVMRAQQHRNHAGMPVVAVQDVRRPIQSRQHVQHRFAEETEPFGFVIEIVQALAAEVVFVIDEIDRHAFVLQLEQAAVLAPPAQLDRLGRHRFQLTAKTLRYVAVQRNDHPGIDLQFFQRPRQRADDVGQSAGLGKRHRFGGGK